ncbi:MAG: undecaprenyldiphospho-muramoylpentapeptide beta-N-acetylglucosaminyltransferase [Eubacteriales bacterium]
MMRILMTGGGTGGHIYPALTIADKIKRKNPGAEFLFVGTMRGMEKDIVPQNGYKIEFIDVSGFDRKNLLKNFKTLTNLFRGIKQAKEIIGRFKPDMVIGTGGYVCGPVVRAAYKLGIKTYIHEQNALPGMTNKMLEKFSNKVFISFEESRKYFKNGGKLILSGNPIRKEFLMQNNMENRKNLQISEGDFAVLCFSGSQGSQTINTSILEAIEKLASEEKIKLFFITGNGYYDQVCQTLKEKNLWESESIKVLPYTHELYKYMSAADVVISRAGALTVSEITACGKASILIPSPYVANNHQYYNAKILADASCSILLEEKELVGFKLYDTIMRLKNNKELVNRMSTISAKLGKLDAVEIIYENIEI